MNDSMLTNPRAVAAEIHHRSSDAETKIQWTVELKNMIDKLQAAAQEDMRKITETPPSGMSSRRKNKHPDRKKRARKDDDSSHSSARGALHVEEPKKPVHKDPCFLWGVSMSLFGFTLCVCFVAHLLVSLAHNL